MSSGAELEVRELSAWYGQAQALFGVSLQVAAGQVLGIAGRNGAGKSTLLRSIARAHRQASGQVRLDGQELARRSPEAVAVLGLSLVREGARVFGNLTVAEHLALAERLAEARGQARRSLDDVLDIFPILGERLQQKAGYLSGGQRQALAVAKAFGSRPRCLLLDEPSAGLARPVAETMFQSIKRLAEEGMTLVVAEQEPSWLEGLADRVCVLQTGRIAA